MATATILLWVGAPASLAIHDWQQHDITLDLWLAGALVAVVHLRIARHMYTVPGPDRNRRALWALLAGPLAWLAFTLADARRS